MSTFTFTSTYMSVLCLCHGISSVSVFDFCLCVSVCISTYIWYMTLIHIWHMIFVCAHRHMIYVCDTHMTYDICMCTSYLYQGQVARVCLRHCAEVCTFWNQHKTKRDKWREWGGRGVLWRNAERWASNWMMQMWQDSFRGVTWGIYSWQDKCRLRCPVERDSFVNSLLEKKRNPTLTPCVSPHKNGVIALETLRTPLSKDC